MTRLRTLTGVALHEMWISFRLILVIGLPMIGGMAVIALPPSLAGVTAVGGASYSYAVASSVAICIAAGLAAGTIAHERQRGTLAWMAVRAVPRSAVLLSWFLAFGLLLAIGIAVGSGAAWLAAIGRAEAPPDPVPFASAVAATLAVALAAVALGLLIGTVLRTVVATFMTLALVGVLLASALAAPAGGAPPAAGGIGLLAHLEAIGRPISLAAESAGIALAVAAALLVLAVVALDRRDL